MIIFLFGPDDYRREQKKKFYIEEFKKKYSGLSVSHFDLTEENKPNDLAGFLRGQSIFESKKLAVVENLSGAEEKKLAGIFKTSGLSVDKKATDGDEHNQNTVLFSESKKPPKVLGFLLEKPSKTEEFAILSGAEWLRFIDGVAGKIGLFLEPAAKNFLAEVYAGDSWGLVTELEKISNLKKTVNRKDLENLGLEVAPNYWAVINGVRSASIATSLRAVEKLSSQNEPAAKVFNIISSLWKEKTPQMAEYDFMVKSGKLEYEEALLELVLP